MSKQYDYDKVIDLYEQGKSTQEIAKELNASLRTIQRYVKEYKGESLDEDEESPVGYDEPLEDTVDMGTITLHEDGKALVVPDMHAPFSDVKYITWLKKVYKREKCSYIVILGDMFDNHTMSAHPKSTSSVGTLTEYMRAVTFFKKFLFEFKDTKIYYCLGNHDIRITRLASGLGIPKEFLKSFKDLFQFPENVAVASSFVINNVLFTHGTEFSGRNSITSVTNFTHKSTVLGHAHSNFGVFYTNGGYDQLYCMYCGCLLDTTAYAFEYGAMSKFKPVLGCGVVVNDKEAYCIPYTE